MKKNRISSRLHRRRSSDSEDVSSWTLQSCAIALLPLLECDGPIVLSPHQLDAVQFLTSVDGDVAEHTRVRQILRARIRRKMGKVITAAFKETEDDDKQVDENASETYQNILHVFGGDTMCNEYVEFKTKTNATKVVRLRKGRVSGNRMDKLLSSYKDNGKLSLGDLGSFASFDEQASSQSCPPEWNKLSPEAKADLVNLLSWESLSSWNFSVVEVSRLTRDPLLLVGWAILCAPIAQKAMRLSIGDDSSGDSESYQYCDRFSLNPATIINFLREVERRYPANPYHSNIHAADVTQTTHCLLQYMGEYRSCIYDGEVCFALILAATFHDIGHPGTNNLFQQNAMTSLAIQYNDVSILENMHSAVGHSLLFGEEKRDEWDVFADWPRGEKVRMRNTMKSAILYTDMSAHFSKMEELDSLVRQVHDLESKSPLRTVNGDHGRFVPSEELERECLPILEIVSGRLSSDQDGKEECQKLADLILLFLLHAADISNPTKREELAIYWANGALEEFFAQGDKEKEMGLPISPLCDRNTVKRPDSQMGFIKFVIQPTFDLLGEIIPKVKQDVIPTISQNLGYWMREKSQLSLDEEKN